MSAREPDEALGCRKCGMFGCDCDASEVISPFPQVGPLADPKAVCSVCRRARPNCICVSHVDIPHPPLSHTGDPIPPKNIDEKVNDGMAYYYNRDAIGLQRYLRGILKD